MSWPSQMCPHCLLTKTNINMVSEVKIWSHGGQSPAQIQHLMHLPNVDATFQHLMHLPNVEALLNHHSNNWCTFQLLMPFFYCCYATFQQVDAPSNCWCHFYYQTFPTIDAYFLSINKFCLIFPQKKGTKLILTTTKDCQSWTCWCTFQQFDAIFLLLLCNIPTSWCTFQLLIPFLLHNITAVDAPVPTVDASFILLLKLLFSQTQPWDAQNH